MEITLNKKNGTEGLIKIKLNQGDYQPQVEEKMRDYARKANIKGFRQGKVPTGVIKKMFGKSIVVEEVNQVLSHKLSDYIKDNNLKILGEPLPDLEKSKTIDWDNPTDLEFEYQIGMVEDFAYDLSSKVKIKSYPIEVDTQVIDETVADLKKRFGKVSYPDVSESTDNFFGELKAVDSEWKNEQAAINGDKIKDAKKFSGLKKGDEVTIDIQKLYNDAELLAGLLGVSASEANQAKGKYTFKVESISRVEPAALNQELFDRVFGKDTVNSEAAFIDKIKETISGNYQRETNHFVDHHIEDHFISTTKINLPEDFLKKWLKATSEGKIDDHVLDKEFGIYKRSLIWDLVKNKIAEDHKISVDTEEVKAKAKEMIVAQFGGPAFAEQLSDRLDGFVDNYLSHENGQNFIRLYNQLRNEKILSFVKEKITLVEKKVSLDEFKKIVAEHTH